MTNLERLKLELSNKSYYADKEYSVFLNENNLVPTDTYNKVNNEIDLLKTVVNILETLSNDVDLMRKIDSKDITSIDQASLYLSKRIVTIENKILDLEEKKNGNSNTTYLFYR